MTHKEFYTAVIAADLSAEITAKATALLSAVEAKSAKSAAKSSATKSANLAIAEKIAAYIDTAAVFAVSEIKALIAEDEELAALSTSKLSAVCKAAVEGGIFSEVEGYKVGGKGRAVKGYALAEKSAE